MGRKKEEKEGRDCYGNEVGGGERKRKGNAGKFATICAALIRPYFVKAHLLLPSIKFPR